MSDDDYSYPELEKTLIEIEEPEESNQDEDILPVIIDVEEKEDETDINQSIENIYKNIRERLISVIRRRIL
tara:strand:+ start:447 stop:659 length:213 start_codon:yes stop_codon:yes gene_type:complete